MKFHLFLLPQICLNLLRRLILEMHHILGSPRGILNKSCQLQSTSRFGQIHLAISTNPFRNWTTTFRDLANIFRNKEKYMLQCGQIQHPQSPSRILQQILSTPTYLFQIPIRPFSHSKRKFWFCGWIYDKFRGWKAKISAVLIIHWAPGRCD